MARLVQDAQHRVAVNDQPRHIGHRARPDLLAPLARRQARHRRHEVAQRLADAQHLAQLHADPARIDDAHVQRQQPRQPVEGARIVAGEADRAGSRDMAALGRRQRDFLERQREGLAAGRVVDVDRPGQRAVDTGARLLAAEHRVEHRRRAAFLQRAELLAAPADHRGGGGDHAGKAPTLAGRREGHVEGALLGHRRQRVELELEPARVVGTHVHRQRLGQRRQPARLLGAVEPDLEGQRLAEQARVRPGLGRQLADEEREVAVRMLDQVAPGRIAGGQFRPARPAQAGEHRLRQPVQAQAAVGAVVARLGHRQRLRLRRGGQRRCGGGRRGGRGRRSRRRIDAQHRAQHAVGAIGRQPLQPGLPGDEVQVLEVLVRVVGRHVDRLADRGVDEGRHRRDHRLVRLGAHLQRGDEGLGQRRVVALQVAVQAPGVVLDRVLAEAAVGLALAPGVGPAERRLDAVAGVVGEGQADRAGRRDRQQMRVAQAVGADALLQVGRKP